MKPSKQRAMIALKSYPSVKSAARSLGTTTDTLLRMTIEFPELAKAYKECVDGSVRARARLAADATKRENEAQPKPISARTAERRQARFFTAIGKDPRLAAAALHKRINRERRQEKMADLKDALDNLEEIQKVGTLSKPLRKSTLDVFDRWCGNCKASRVDDPCEVCGRHTILVKGDGGPTTRTESS